jgi:hypothetical protein
VLKSVRTRERVRGSTATQVTDADERFLSQQEGGEGHGESRVTHRSHATKGNP